MDRPAGLESRRKDDDDLHSPASRTSHLEVVVRVVLGPSECGHFQEEGVMKFEVRKVWVVVLNEAEAKRLDAKDSKVRMRLVKGIIDELEEMDAPVENAVIEAFGESFGIDPVMGDAFAIEEEDLPFSVEVL